MDSEDQTNTEKHVHETHGISKCWQVLLLPSPVLALGQSFGHAELISDFSGSDTK